MSGGGVASERTVRSEPAAWIIQCENDAAAADLVGDVSFYQKNLTDDRSDGMSNGQFQNKKELISDLTDKAHNITFHETLANMKVRVYGDTVGKTGEDRNLLVFFRSGISWLERTQCHPYIECAQHHLFDGR